MEAGGGGLSEGDTPGEPAGSLAGPEDPGGGGEMEEEDGLVMGQYGNQDDLEKVENDRNADNGEGQINRNLWRYMFTVQPILNYL